MRVHFLFHWKDILLFFFFQIPVHTEIASGSIGQHATYSLNSAASAKRGALVWHSLNLW